MKKSHLMASAAFMAAGALLSVSAFANSKNPADAVEIAARADNFRLTDQHSKSHELYYYKDAPAIVIVTQQNGAKAMREAAPAINALNTEFAPNGVRVFLLNSTPSNDRASITAEIKSIGLDLPVLQDDAQLIGESLGVSQVAQTLVIEPKTWKVVFSGPASKARDAIANLVAGKAVTAQTVALDTPTIAFPNRDRKAEHAKISYAKDVAPILAKNCATCHSQGGIGPFAMDGYDKVKGFAPMIREALRTDRMPPFNSDPHVGKYIDDMNLSAKDTQTLVHWVEAGAPRGEGGDPLKVNAKPAPEWELGPPDLIVDIPAFTLPASGVVDYQYPTVTLPISEKRYVKAVTFNVGERQAVHHIVSALGDYAVGAETIKFPEGQGIPIEPGQVVRPSMHYTPFGKEVTDKTRIGLYLYPKDKPPAKVRRNVIIANAAIEIPPNTPRHQETAYATFSRDFTLYSVFPHSHYRGENAQIFVKKPGEEEKLIVSLPKYDFNWQRGYYFETPMELPAGTKIITRYEFDNSKANPANPDPSISVRWGEQSWEEMQYTEMSITWKDETVDNLKPEYMQEFSNSRAMGLFDSDIDGKVAKTELRGRIGEMMRANFDKFDTDKDGFLTDTEAAALVPIMNRRITEAQNVLATGTPSTAPKPQ